MKSVFKTLKKAKYVPQTFVFLIGWIIYGDGTATFGAISVIFMKSELKVDSMTIGICVIMAPVCSASKIELQKFYL